MALALTTGAAVLAYAGVTAPTADQTIRAASVALAINAAITTALDWPADRDATDDETAELAEAALIAASELYARRSAPFGVTTFADYQGAAIRIARDPLTGIGAMVARHRHGAAGNFG